jgi:hypothetical protein
MRVAYYVLFISYRVRGSLMFFLFGGGGVKREIVKIGVLFNEI